MQYMKTLLVLVVILAVVVFGINNTQSFALSFMSFQLIWQTPLWVLLMAAFFAGMVPIFIVSLPEKTAYFNRVRSLRIRQRRLEKELRAIDRRASASAP